QKDTKSELYEPAQTGTGTTAGTTAGGNAGASTSAAGVLLSQETKTETYSGSVVPPANLPNRTNVRNASGADNYTRTETTAQYQVTKRIEQTVSAPGQIKRLSVAVLVDDRVEPAKLPAIEQAVAAAAGIDPARGDRVTVQRLAFDTTQEKVQAEEMAKASRSEMIGSIAKNASALIILAAFFVILRLIVRQIRLQVPSGLSSETSNVEAVTQVSRSPTTTPAPYSPEDLSRMQDVKGPPTDSDGLPPEIVQSKPEDLAKLVRSWMSEQ
ncbi:MAG: flagellar M-ring protein FliF C-terminal domain-containing protein, partial [Armatimonadota bacterium]